MRSRPRQRHTAAALRGRSGDSDVGALARPRPAGGRRLERDYMDGRIDEVSVTVGVARTGSAGAREPAPRPRARLRTASPLYPVPERRLRRLTVRATAAGEPRGGGERSGDDQRRQMVWIPQAGTLHRYRRKKPRASTTQGVDQCNLHHTGQRRVWHFERDASGTSRSLGRRPARCASSTTSRKLASNARASTPTRAWHRRTLIRPPRTSGLWGCTENKTLPTRPQTLLRRDSGAAHLTVTDDQATYGDVLAILQQHLLRPGRANGSTRIS
jgi:hypothetical protein